MKTKKRTEKLWLDEKYLKNTAFLLYENYKISEKELEECKRIMENFEEHSQSSSG